MFEASASSMIFIFVVEEEGSVDLNATFEEIRTILGLNIL
jgi:hypothetical protein